MFYNQFIMDFLKPLHHNKYHGLRNTIDLQTNIKKPIKLLTQTYINNYYFSISILF